MSRPLRSEIKSASLIAMGVPKSMCEYTLDDFEAEEGSELFEVKEFVREYIDDLDEQGLFPNGISFFGSNGVGKTMLSCIILKEFYRHRLSCRRITLAEYINKFTKTWEDKEETEYLQFLEAEFLCLDEVGKEIDSKIAKPILESLLRYRDEHLFPTIICSNMTPQNFKEFYGNSIASLVNGNSTIIVIEAEDRRAK